MVALELFDTERIKHLECYVKWHKSKTMLIFVIWDIAASVKSWLYISRVTHARILLMFVATILTLFIFGLTFLMLKRCFFFPINNNIGKLFSVKCYLFVIPGFIIAGLMDITYHLC